MSQLKSPLIIKIISSLGTVIFNCGIYSNWQMNVHLTSTVKLDFLKFHNDTSTTLGSAPTCSVIDLHLLVEGVCRSALMKFSPGWCPTDCSLILLRLRCSGVHLLDNNIRSRLVPIRCMPAASSTNKQCYNHLNVVEPDTSWFIERSNYSVRRLLILTTHACTDSLTEKLTSVVAPPPHVRYCTRI